MRGVRDGENGGGGENFAKMIEGVLLERGPRSRLILFGEEGKRSNNVGIVWNEFAIKVCKP